MLECASRPPIKVNTSVSILTYFVVVCSRKQEQKELVKPCKLCVASPCCVFGEAEESGLSSWTPTLSFSFPSSFYFFSLSNKRKFFFPFSLSGSVLIVFLSALKFFSSREVR